MTGALPSAATAAHMAVSARVAVAPPWTWPRQELLVDVAHKAVYAFATGAVADALAARSGPGPGGAHARLRPGRHADVGPPPRPD